MKNNKGFTLIELLAVIVVLAIVMVLATTTVLPYMATAREDAFRIEASNAVEAADYAMSLYTIGDFTFTNDKDSKLETIEGGKKACFTIQKLIDTGAFKADPDTFEGKVIVETKDKKNEYTLYLKKNEEFKIIDGKGNNYNKKEIALQNADNWLETYSSCASE